MSKTFLTINEQLSMGEYLMSNNGTYKAIFQDDGNFVVYDCSNSPRKAMWSTGTQGSDAVRVIMQDDSNLVIYNQADQSKWSSGTNIEGTCDSCRVELTDGGKLELTRNAKVWSS